MNITITASFKSSGTPQTGLSPTVTVWQVNGTNKTVVKTDQPMSEMGNGVYAYNFDQFNALHDYLFLMDAGATSDSRYLEVEWNGYKSLVDLIPRGGGGGGGVSSGDIARVIEALKESLEGFLNDFQLDFDIPEASTKEIEKLIKEAQQDKNKGEARLLKLIDQAEKKVTEIKNPVIKTEIVDLNALERNLKAELVQSITKAGKDQGNANTEEIENVLVDFIKLFRKDLEKTRDIMKAEVEAEVIAEFKNKLRS